MGSKVHLINKTGYFTRCGVSMFERMDPYTTEIHKTLTSSQSELLVTGKPSSSNCISCNRSNNSEISNQYRPRADYMGTGYTRGAYKS